MTRDAVNRDAVNRDAMNRETPSGRIAAELRHRIVSGRLGPGERVPSARQITREWGVAIATATKVLTALRDEGLVRAVPGVGTVVATATATATAAAPAAPAAAAARAAPAGSAPARRPPHSGTRPQRQELTKEAIVRAAIAIADAEGLAALSMRRVAADFGVATMALYRYVHSKDDLVLMMADTTLGEEPLPETPPPGWRARLELTARMQWSGYRRHPWLPHILSLTRPQLLPNGMAHTDWALGALDGMGLAPDVMLHVAVCVFGYVRGIAAGFEAEAQAEQDTGMTGDEWMQSQESTFAAVFGSGRFPTLGRIAETEIDLDLDSLFEFGLGRMLDGIAAYLRRPPER